MFPNYLLGLPDSYLQGSAQTEDIRGNSVYLFAQDSWKIRPNLTLNYGLRWEFNQPIYDAGKRYQTFRPGQATTTYPCQLSAASQASLGYLDDNCNPGGSAAAVFPLGLVVPGDKGVPRGLTDSYYKSFAPRIGIAWDPWKNGKTTIRGGFGLFYNPIEQLVLEQFQGEPPFGGSSLLAEGLFNTPFVSSRRKPEARIHLTASLILRLAKRWTGLRSAPFFCSENWSRTCVPSTRRSTTWESSARLAKT